MKQTVLSSNYLKIISIFAIIPYLFDNTNIIVAFSDFFLPFETALQIHKTLISLKTVIPAG